MDWSIIGEKGFQMKWSKIMYKISNYLKQMPRNRTIQYIRFPNHYSLQIFFSYISVLVYTSIYCIKIYAYNVYKKCISLHIKKVCIVRQICSPENNNWEILTSCITVIWRVSIVPRSTAPAAAAPNRGVRERGIHRCRRCNTTAGFVVWPVAY